MHIKSNRKSHFLRSAETALFLFIGTHLSPGQAQPQYVWTTNLVVAADDTIASANADTASGDQFFVNIGVDSYGTNRGLLQLDLSPIPTNATIKSVTLSLPALTTPPAGVQFGLSRLLTNWDYRFTTWNRRYFSPPSWAGPGGLAGTDFNALPSALATAANPLTFTDNGSNPSFGLVYDLQQWISQPAQNFGWILIAADESLTNSFFSVGDGQTYGATVTVGYTKPMSPPLIYDIMVTNGYMQFSFNVEPYHGYIVQGCDDLTQSNWVHVLTFDPLTFPGVATSYDHMTSSNRFYRVVTQ